MEFNMITEGVVSFSNLTRTELYNGQDTGKYSIVILMEQEEADKLAEEGVVLREYKNQPQRKFTTKFEGFQVLNAEGDSVSKDIPWGSKVRILWSKDKPHPVHGTPTYFKKIKVLEYADVEGMGGSGEDESDF